MPGTVAMAPAAAAPEAGGAAAGGRAGGADFGCWAWAGVARSGPDALPAAADARSATPRATAARSRGGAGGTQAQEPARRGDGDARRRARMTSARIMNGLLV